jgi:hypothetical protein
MNKRMNKQLSYEILDREITYTGRELRSGWVSDQTGLTGEAAVGFFGPCRVATEDLVDLEDARAGATIESRRMAHLIVELPGCSLPAAVLSQRLLVCLLSEILVGRGVKPQRTGDDIFIGERKLTVSIAAPGRWGCLIHLGINVDPSGAPVPAVGLLELGVDPGELIENLLERFRAELASARRAERKVRSVP